MTEATSFRAATRWKPTPYQLRRGRIAMEKAFNRSGNLPLRAFAMRSGRSVSDVLLAVRRRRLLGLRIGKRGPHIPAWQLEAIPRRLTEKLLRDSHDVDEWTLYFALSRPYEEFGDRIPIEVVTFGSFERVYAEILTRLGIHL